MRTRTKGKRRTHGCLMQREDTHGSVSRQPRSLDMKEGKGEREVTDVILVEMTEEKPREFAYFESEGRLIERYMC